MSAAAEIRDTPATGPAPARSRRDLVVLVVTALVAGALLLGVTDRLARSAAVSLLSGELQRLTGTEPAPEVQLHGSSFLIQALSGRYDRADVTVRGLSSGSLRIERLQARLSGVRLPFSELVRRNPGVLAVEAASAQALLSYEDLDRYLEFTGRPYTVRPGRDPLEVEITGRVQVLGGDYDVSADAVLGAEGGALTVTPTSLRTGTDLDGPAELLLSQRFTFRVPLDPLPFGQRVTDIAAGPEGVVVRTAAGALLLRPR
jgi:LmeA-like phospholipid-binding